MVRVRGRFRGILNPDEYERPKKSGLPKIGNSAPKKVATDSNKIGGEVPWRAEHTSEAPPDEPGTRGG